MRVDVHQHLWSEPLVAALARRRRAPRVRRDGCRWVLELAAEPPATIDVAGDAPERRAGLVCIDGLDRAVLSLSGALGVEALPPDEARALIAAYHEGVADAGAPFAAWGALALADATAADVDAALDGDSVGICVPAGALSTPTALERTGPLLEALERRDAPLFVHPGPDPWAQPADAVDAPAWWPAMTDYVAGMNAAWHAFVARGRDAHPRLRVLFAMFAGGAPLHRERLAARGGPIAAARDRRLFYDTSSYGPTAIDAMVGVVGVDQLVHGSDRPVVAPTLPPAGTWWDALVRRNPARLLGALA